MTKTVIETAAPLPAFLAGGGACGALIAEKDWAATPLGLIEGWPQSLRTASAILLRSPVPMVMLWGEDGVMIYNDAYSGFAGGRHPALLGSRVREGWPEIADFNDHVMRVGLAGGTLAYRDAELTLHRHGRPEPVFMNLDYSPVPGDDGAPAGVLAVVVETTGRVLAERRQAFLIALGDALRDLSDPLAITGAAARLLGEHLGAGRAGYGEIDAGGEVVSVARDWTGGTMASLAGEARILDAFGPEVIAELRAGRTLVVEDCRTDPRTCDPAFLATWDGIGTRALVVAPLLGGGRLSAILYVHSAEPRPWSPLEVSLVGDVGARTRGAVARARVEHALRDSEERARAEAERVQSALDAGAIRGTWTYHIRDDRFIADEPCARTFGLDPEAARAGVPMEQGLAAVHPEDVGRLAEIIPGLLARGGRGSHDVRVRGPDGVFRWIEASGLGLPGADGTTERLTGVIIDIEERRAVEAERDRARRLLETFAEAVPGVVFAKDREGRMLLANRGTTELIGKPPEAYLGRTDAEFLDDPAQGRAIMETDRRIMESGVAEQLEEAVSLPDGSPAVWYSTKAPLRDEEGRVVGLIGSSIDVTARRRAETALAESEERFRFALDAAGGIGTWDWDIPGNRVHTSEKFARMYGLDPEAARTGLPVADYVEGIHPGDRPEVERLIQEAVATGGDYRAEYRIETREGETRWVIARGRCLKDEAGRPVRFPGVTFDITDRKEAEEELAARTAELESLLVSAPLGIAFFDRGHRWVRINEALAAINGFPAADHIGRRMEELLPVNARLVTPVLDRVFATGEPVRNLEVAGEVPSAPGQPRHWLVNYYPVRDGEGAVTSVGTWVVDITERKEAEARALDSEARLRAVIEAAPVGLVFADAEGRITGGNARVEEIVAHPILPSQGVDEYRQWVSFHPDGRQVEGREYPLSRALAGEERPELEVLYQRGDGRRAWVKFIASAVRDARGQVAGGVVASLDIDRERRAEAELRAVNETLEHRVEEAIAQREQAEEALRQSQKMEAVGQLTGGIAHDFNNMLAAVIGSLDLLGRRIGEGDPRSQRYVEGAMEGARRAAALTQRLLAFSRQQPLKPAALDANRLVLGMSDLLSRSLGAGVRLETVLEGGLWKAHADPNQLENVILNLALNARDAMEEGGQLTVETSNAELSPGRPAGRADVPPGDYVRIAVTDTGAGMTPEVIARAFEPFFTTKPVGRGTGLGLSQVYGFVRQSGGHVTIRSEPGRGTTVSVFLPRHLRALSEDLPEHGPRALPRGRPQDVVLVVEDEAVVRQFTMAALRELGYSALEADGAEAALRLLDGHPEVRLLFTDIVMPDTDGRRLADEARRRRPDLRVLFTTGYTRDEGDQAGIPSLGAHLLGKPFTVEALATKLREALEDRVASSGMANPS